MNGEHVVCSECGLPVAPPGPASPRCEGCGIIRLDQQVQSNDAFFSIGLDESELRRDISELQLKISAAELAMKTAMFKSEETALKKEICSLQMLLQDLEKRLDSYHWPTS